MIKECLGENHEEVKRKKRRIEDIRKTLIAVKDEAYHHKTLVRFCRQVTDLGNGFIRLCDRENLNRLGKKIRGNAPENKYPLEKASKNGGEKRKNSEKAEEERQEKRRRSTAEEEVACGSGGAANVSTDTLPIYPFRQ